MVGLLLLWEHHDRLDRMMPAQPVRSGQWEDGAEHSANGPLSLLSLRRDAIRPPAPAGKPSPQGASPAPAQAAAQVSPAAGAPAPSVPAPSAPDAQAQALVKRLIAENSKLMQQVAALRKGGAAVNATALEEPKESRQARVGLQAWLKHVATLQEVEAIYTLCHWFQYASVEDVNATLNVLMAQDTSSAWSTCAVEDEICRCPSGKIRYGHLEKRWLNYEKPTKELTCNLRTFGNNDVAVGLTKQCQCWQVLEGTAGMPDLQEVFSTLSSSDSIGGQIWSKLRSVFKPVATVRNGLQPSTASAPPGSLWLRLEYVVDWVEIASVEQLVIAGRVYKWLENTRSTAQITVALDKAAAPAVAQGMARCQDGQPIDARRCPGHGQVFCRAGCVRSPQLLPKGEPSQRPKRRAALCGGEAAVELLWSCNAATSRLPDAGHAHAKAQQMLDDTAKGMCDDGRLRDQLAVYLDCEYVESYLNWTSEESEWLEEAYVSYVAGRKDSNYEWQATNLVRSVDLFSNRPIVVVVFGDEFVPPASWRGLPNLIVYRMSTGLRMVSFNFNKIRSMISSRVLFGIQLDTDQIIAPGMDQLFAGTRREIHEHHPWPMLPVHWMSREGKKPEPYWEYAFNDWPGKRTMRWGHAHPSWSYWALAFLTDMLHERLAATIEPGAKLLVWNLPEAKDVGLPSVIKRGVKVERIALPAGFMREDEDMLNVALWRDGVAKDWCKYDLEWGLYKERMQVDHNLYWDPKWYPDGMPVVYISMHNTKQFAITDWLLSLLARCDKEQAPLSCPYGKDPPRFCQDGSSEELKWRRQPLKYSANMCCCLEPRQKAKVYWAGQWFGLFDKVPMRVSTVRKERTCTIP